VERFNGRISGVVQQTRFTSSAELETTLTRYLNIYNNHIPQRALHHLTPIQSLKKWYTINPDLFVKRVYKQTGLDSYIPKCFTNFCQIAKIMMLCHLVFVARLFVPLYWANLEFR